MPKNRIGFATDFNLTNSKVGIGTTNPRATLDVVGVLKGDFIISGVTTLTSYGGFVGQKQNISIASSVGFTTTGIGTVGITSFISTNEKDYGYISLIGEYNTVSEDIVVDEGRIFDISTITNIGITTLGTQSVYVPTSSVVNVGTLESVSIGTHFSPPNGGIAARQEEPIEGTVRFNDDLNTLEFYNGVEWRQFTVDGSSGRGVFGGGVNPSLYYTRIDYITISTQGNTQNFGDLIRRSSAMGGGASSTRGIFGGGYVAPTTTTNIIDYITIASEGNAIDFGDTLYNRRSLMQGCCSSSTRALFSGGETPANAYNYIDYVTIATLGNALDFGDLTVARNNACTMSNSTRGIFAGGDPGSSPNTSNIIDFVTISSTGNAVSFGDLTERTYSNGGVANSTRGLISGGLTPSPTTNRIEYITISSVGDGTDFGNLTSSRSTAGTSVGNNVRAVFGGSGTSNIMDFVTIASSGNAQDFGDVSDNIGNRGSVSDSHGGLGGF